MIDKNKILALQDKIKLALESIEKEENIKIDFSGITFNNTKYWSKMTVLSLDNTDLDTIMLDKCKKVGFTQNVIGMKFIGKNGIYEIIDIRPRSPKYPVIGKSPDGRCWKYSVADIKNKLGGDKLINRNSNLKKLL